MNRLTRRSSLLLPLAALATASAAHAQEYPTRQITLISPWPAGGSIDALCRGIAPRLAELLGKPVVVENRPGAGSVTGTAAGAKAAPDGYTLVMGGSGSLAISPTLYKKLPYDPATDFAPLMLAAKSPFFLVVHPSLPVHSVADLVRYAKDNPGKLAFASGGAGGPHQLFAELLKSLTGIEMAHIPYKGNAPAMNDVLAGHVPMMFSDPVAALSLVRAGKVRALGVTTAVRSPSAPEIPPIAESGAPAFDLAGWGLITAPAATPKPIVARLNAELNKVIAMPEVRQQIITLGSIPGAAASPDELQHFINAEMERWGKIVRLAGLAGSE